MKRYLAIVVLLVFAWGGSALADSTAISDAQNTQAQTAIGNQSTAVTTTNVNQVQQQSSSLGLANVGNSSAGVSFSNSFNSSQPIRFLPDAAPYAVTTRGGPAIFGTPNYKDRGNAFISMGKLVNLLPQIDIAEAMIDNKGKIDEVIQLINTLDEEEVQAAAEEENYALEFSLINGNAPHNLDVIAIVTLSSEEDEKVNSATLAVRMAHIAKKLGGHKVAFLHEGAEKRVSSWGVGIGASWSMAKVGSDVDDSGSVGAGGTGWSWGRGERESLPYLSAIIAK